MAKQYCVHGEEDCLRCAMSEVQAPTIHLHILLDISTSMFSRWKQTISGLNEYIEALRLDNSPYKVTLTEFGLENEVVDLCTEADLDKVPKLEERTYQPHGRGTALWGAVGITLAKVNTKEPVLFVVITDGEDNSSHAYGSKEVNELIEERQKLGNYTFAYLGVAKEAWGQEAKVAAFAASNHNVSGADYNSDTYRSLATCTRSYTSTMTSNALHGQAMSVHSLFDQGSLVPAADAEPVVSVTGADGTVPPRNTAGWQTGQ